MSYYNTTTMKQLNILFLCQLITSLLFAEIPAGYYHKANHKHGAQLLDALNNICSNGTFLGYGSGEGYTWQGFYYTDRNADGSIIDMYSDIIRYQYDFNSVEGLHIEHSLPKSWWGALENYAYRDLHHLFPADATTNSTKNNLPLGNVIEATFDNGVSKIGTTNIYRESKCFEPANEYKGDFARAYFYISTTYNELSDLWQSPMMDNNTYPVWTAEALNLLLQWHRQDPVSEKELKRQEAVYQIQHNRNPFIDYPEMIEHIWGNKKEQDLALPEELRPFLTSPQQWTIIELPVSYIGTTATHTIRFEGANFTNNIPLKLTNQSSEITLSTQSLTPTNIANGYNLTISIVCNQAKSILDTLLICTPDTIRLPISATFTDEFMVTSAQVLNPVSTTITWTQLPNAQHYDITLYDQPNNRTADLFFSAYVEGSSYNKAIAIYNGTGHDIDLKYYSIRKQNNGTGTFKSDLPLSGTLRNGEHYIIANSQASADILNIAHLKAYSYNDKNNAMNFNGNDAIALYHNGILLDIIGEVNNSADWGKDLSLKRNPSIIAPNNTFNWNEWTQSTKDDISPLTNHKTTLTQSTKSNTYTSTTNSITIDNLTPRQTYYVEVKTNQLQSSNLLAFTMPGITTPEAYEATNVYATQFTANWEEIKYVDAYIVQLFQMSETQEVIVEENFDAVGSNGKPLPEGWTGTASGNYTSDASSGKSAPSIALKNNGEYLQTPITPSPITYFEFLYRFPSAATGSYFIVYSLDQQGNATEIDRIEYAGSTKKSTLKYDNLSNTYSLRIEYNKSSGNLAIDDVIYRYGKSSTNIITTQQTTNNWFMFNNLTPNTTYHYQVQAIVDNADTTTFSNIITVVTNTTPAPVGIQHPETHYNWFTSNNILYLNNLTPGSNIRIYNTLGICLYNLTTSTNQRVLPLHTTGVHIIQIIDNQQIDIIKLKNI